MQQILTTAGGLQTTFIQMNPDNANEAILVQDGTQQPINVLPMHMAQNVSGIQPVLS